MLHFPKTKEPSIKSPPFPHFQFPFAASATRKHWQCHHLLLLRRRRLELRQCHARSSSKQQQQRHRPTMWGLAGSAIRAARGVQRSALGFLHRFLPASFFALLLLLLLAYNAASIFSVRVPADPLRRPPPSPSAAGAKISSGGNVMYAVREENPPPVSRTQLALLQKDEILTRPIVGSPPPPPPQPKGRRRPAKRGARALRLGAQSTGFAARVNGFFAASPCEARFFMTWISSLESFGDREAFAVESLFNSHPDGCLVIVSSSLDSDEGRDILRPFRDKGLKAIAISPNFGYLFRNTHAQLWFQRLKRGRLDPGEVALGQNLSNLLRLVLLYKFGGVYIDTDVVVLKSMSRLRNVIGAQTLDAETGNWSRLNNAVLAFDKGHPLLFKFIQEFALTFDGNKWGHNGPYLVSRVVARVGRRPGYGNFAVMPPSAFYPVDWSRVRSLFRGPRGHLHAKWLHDKLRHIRSRSYAVHLWNKQSRKLRVERGSIVDHIMADCCIFCNRSMSNL